LHHRIQARQMKISIIVAVAENGVIGKDNRLIWHMPADMRFFREKTMGHCVITGRKNYESIPEKFRPLPGRTNIVITRDNQYKAPNAIVVHSIEEALAYARKQNETECFIIGGANVFEQVMHVTDTIYYTKIFHSFEGDVHFPFPDEQTWALVKSETFEANEKNPHPYAFYEFEKIKK
jgi:dihydrofolate reductase